MTAYEIGTEVVIDRLHQRGTISGAGVMEYDGSTGGVYVVDLPGNDTQLVFEEDLTIPDTQHAVDLYIRVTASLEAETAAVAKARLIENLNPRVDALAKEMIEEDRHEEIGYLKLEVRARLDE